MCGIGGLFYLDYGPEVNLEGLKRMGDVIAHRGPDGEGFFNNGYLGLAHRRLSIIDLGTGDQPMFNDSKDIAIVFNGEIYNYIELREELKGLGHAFHTTSDTEVLIRAYEQWGIAFQERLNGMWAFALWDEKERQLLLSRDRAGEKPLYFGRFGDALVFASELKSIGAYGFPMNPNPDMLELYLFLGYIPEPFSFYQDISKLKAAHCIIVKDGQITERAYWTPPEVDENNMRTDEKQIVEEVKEIFKDSVRIRMRSDVPFGAFLSGGLDSSSIVAFMAELQNPVSTFTIGFEEKEFDERGKARIIAEQFKTEHHEHVVELSALDESLNRILHHYDEPFADPAAIPTGYVSKVAREKVKMVLTGDGSDEIFAGYSHYQGEKVAEQYNQLPGFVKKMLPAAVQGASQVFQGGLRYRLNKADRVLNAFNMSFEQRLLSKTSKIPPQLMKQMYHTKPHPVEDFLSDILAASPFTDPFYQFAYYNLKVSLPAQMLVKVDRMTMANSLESRTPFLDHRLIELLYTVDKNIKMPHYKSVKHILKKAVEDKLPKEIVYRKKKGFDVPLREWFKDDTFNTYLNGKLADDALNKNLIAELIEDNKTGKADYGTLIWRLIMYNEWLLKH